MFFAAIDGKTWREVGGSHRSLGTSPLENTGRVMAKGSGRGHWTDARA